MVIRSPSSESVSADPLLFPSLDTPSLSVCTSPPCATVAVAALSLTVCCSPVPPTPTHVPILFKLRLTSVALEYLRQPSAEDSPPPSVGLRCLSSVGIVYFFKTSPSSSSTMIVPPYW